jgi:RNA polymerase sigma-70 factor (ECF subfamily)
MVSAAAVRGVRAENRRHESGIFTVVHGEGRIQAYDPDETVTRRRSELLAPPASSVQPVAKRVGADEEAALVFAMLANDAAAWREFQKRYDRLILRCITKVTKRFAKVGQEDIREIYASLLVSLLANDKTKLRTFDPERGNRFSSWIGLLAIHCAYDYLRQMKREPQKEALAEAAELSSDLPDPFEAAAHAEHANIAQKVLSGFSKKDRAFAALYFGEGMSPDDIAARLNISIKTVYSKKHKIKARLEALLNGAAA